MSRGFTIYLKSISIIIFIFVLIVLFAPVHVLASGISLDPTYGNGGKVITSFGNDSVPSSVILQSDGKEIVVGYASNGINIDWAIMRYNTDGSIDTSFGDKGRVLKDFGNNNDSLESVKIQANGKIVVGGYSHPTGNSDYHWSMARYNSDGSLDTSFANNGIIASFPGIHSVVKSIAIQPDDKIIAAGYRQSGGQDDVAVIRYNSNGSLDTSFDNDGIAITPIGTFNDRGKSVVIQPDNKIVVSGDFDAGLHDDIFLVRYNSDGSLDNSFGNNGKVITQIGGYDQATALALQPDGKLVLVGGTNNGHMDTYVTRYNSNGTSDSTFGSGGKVITSFANGNDSSNSVILQSDGKILLGGYEDTGGVSGTNFALRHFNTDGTLDLSFGTNGSFVTPISSGYDEIRSLALQNDGKIIAAGFASNGSFNDWGLTRYEGELFTSLPVPLLKQTSEPWQSQVYDSANIWSPSNPTINAWGCALSSAAMVLNYHKINKLPDGTELDPGTLNSWLNFQPDGYVGDGLINWLALSRLSKLAKDSGNNPLFSYDALEYQRISGSDSATLTNDINNLIPDILEEPGHFVVAKGTGNATFNINDPFYDRNDLGSYGNTFLSLGRYIPTSTNLSYIMLAADPDIEINLKDSNGNTLGGQFTQGQLANDTETSNLGGSPINIFYLRKPQDGFYQAILTSNNTKVYEVKTYIYDRNGNVNPLTQRGIIQEGSPEAFNISFNNQNANNSSVFKIVTFQSTINDINEAKSLKLINSGVAAAFNSLIKGAQKDYENGRRKISLIRLNIFKGLLNVIPKRLIDTNTYKVLIYDADYLIGHI